MRGWYPRRRGILEHLERGSVSLLDTAIHDVLSLWADHKTGVCWASAEKINALCPAEFSYKTIQRSLARLERIGWIKRWMVKGKRGNYPILVCRFYVRDASMTWLSTNGDNTTDWRDVKFDAVHDLSFNSPSAVRLAVRELGGELSSELSGVQEVRSTKEEKKDDGDTTFRDEKTRRGEPGPQDKSRSQKIKPRLNAWMRARILRRGGGVQKPHAYVRAAQHEFIANLPQEVEEYLTEVAQQFLSNRLGENPNVPVPWNDVFNVLAGETRKHDLPLSGKDLLARATRTASEILGLREIPVEEKPKTLAIEAKP